VQPFLHDRLQRLSDLLDAGSGALRTCSHDELGAAEVVAQFLGAAAERYRALGLQVEENEVLALSAELQAARRGLVLATGERITSRRRDLERTVAVRVLVQSLDRLREAVSRDTDRLRSAREQLAPVVVFALQNGLVTPLDDGEDDGRAAELRWRAVCEDATTRPAALQLLTSTSTADAVLVLLDLLHAVVPPTPAQRSPVWTARAP
jgi:hypothetical protein